MLRGFATINYWADDVEAAKRWYAELLGVEPYFERTGPDGRLAYAEFRIGDYEHELGLIDRGWAPSGAATEPGGGRHVMARRRHRGDVSRSCCRWARRNNSRSPPAGKRGS